MPGLANALGAGTTDKQGWDAAVDGSCSFPSAG